MGLGIRPPEFVVLAGVQKLLALLLAPLSLLVPAARQKEAHETAPEAPAPLL